MIMLRVKYDDRVKLCYMDTDSFVLKCKNRRFL